MIKFINDSSQKPYIRFKEKYKEALYANQNIIEAISIASFSSDTKEVDSRFVNLKIIDNMDFIFFSNYLSPKAMQFQSHNQVSVSIFWNSTNTQIRMKANIKKMEPKYNNQYFMDRSEKKNALAISSKQSQEIDSYESVKKSFYSVLNEGNTKECPDYWGGYSFTPYYFEFWEGHKSRLNKREAYKYDNNTWIKSLLQP